MRPDARLDSVVFQLTPTRTRFDLVLIANGRKEKFASGLLKPFLAHLKAAQDQIAKGGYSITLEPSSGFDAPWFTRGTVERFVRFVSTPEVLERVTTLESEILQLEDAIAIQGNDNLGLKSVEDHGRKLTESNEGGRANYDPDAATAIVVYKPGSHSTAPVQNETAQEENSKAQLLRVLETRKTVLRKEQAMAFARAVAAGFDIDNLGYLIAFAERFGASRLMKACSHFVELWKQKHETGQWIEVEPEAMSTRSEFPPFNASGIVFMGDNMKQNMESGSVNGEANGEDGAKSDQKSGQQMGSQAAYPPWAMHPPSGAVMYPPYPMQGMPFYPGVNPYYPPYPPVDDPRYHYSGRKSSRKHSSDSKDSEILDDESDHSSSDRGSSHGRKSHRKGKRSGKKKSSVVVIKNVNVTSKKHGSSESESQSSSDASEDSDNSHSKSREGKHKSSSSKKKEGRKTTSDSGNEYSKDKISNGQDAEQGNWSAFQNFLLRAEEKTRSSDADMFAGEKEPPSRRKKNVNTADPILLSERDSGNVYERNTVGFDSANGRRAIRVMSNDELVMSGEGRSYIDGEMKEIEAGGGRYRRGTGDDFMVYGQESQVDRSSLLDPLAEARYKNPTHQDKNMNGVADESFMIPLRSSSQDNFGAESRTTIDIDVELPTSIHKTSDEKAGHQLFYEPDELVPERGFEDVSFGYDPAMDYDSHMLMQTTVKVEDAKADDVLPVTEGDVKKAEKDKLRNGKDGSDKRRKDALLRRLSAPRTPLNDAQKRAQNLRAYKADLQKLKKEQEEEQIKRLERLKLERQKRITARGNGKGPGSDSPKANGTNGLSKSVPSFTGLKKEKNKEKNGTTESFTDRLKRLSEPKSIAGVEHSSNPRSNGADHSRRRSMA